MKSLSVTIQMKATEQHFPVVLFIMLYKVVLTFQSVDEILKCDHSNESCCGTLLMKVVLTLKTVHKNPTVRPFETKTKLNCTGSHAHTGLLIAFYSF